MKDKYKTEFACVGSDSSRYFFIAQNEDIDGEIAVMTTEKLLESMKDASRYFTGKYNDNGYSIVCEQNIISHLSNFIPKSLGTYRLMPYIDVAAFPSDVTGTTKFIDVMRKYPEFCELELFILTDQRISQAECDELTASLKKLNIPILVKVSLIPAEEQAKQLLDAIAIGWGSRENSLFSAEINLVQSSPTTKVAG